MLFIHTYILEVGIELTKFIYACSITMQLDIPYVKYEMSRGIIQKREGKKERKMSKAALL